jgi:hypothetical protein
LKIKSFFRQALKDINEHEEFPTLCSLTVRFVLYLLYT